MKRSPPVAPIAVRAQADRALAALVDLPPRYGFVVVITDTRNGDHTYYSDLTADSAAVVLAEVVDALTPAEIELEN